MPDEISADDEVLTNIEPSAEEFIDNESSVNKFTERSLTKRKTRVLCRLHAGLSAVLTVQENLAILGCGCVRAQSLPVTPGTISCESLAPFVPKAQQKLAAALFPASNDSERTSQRMWFEKEAA